MSISDEISCIGFDDVLVVTLCASLAIVENICLKLLCENLNLYLNYLNVFVVNP